MIYIFFQPLNIKEKKIIDVPLFEIQEFTMYELDKLGLKTILLGSSSKRYRDRYTVKDMDYTDNSDKYIANMLAKNGLYKGNIVNLDGNVTYTREDGLSFKSDRAKYNKTTSIVSTDTHYTSHKGDNIVIGSSVEYNNITNKMKSSNVRATYQLKERK